MSQTTVKAVLMTNLNAAALPVGYIPINPLGLTNACFRIRIINSSNTPLTLSLDGINDNDYIPADSIWDEASQAQSQFPNREALYAKGQIFYVLGAAGVGTIYLAGYYV